MQKAKKLYIKKSENRHKRNNTNSKNKKINNTNQKNKELRT